MMKLHLIILLTGLFLTGMIHAFELVVIQGVSNTKRTFIVRHGKQNGLVEGVIRTFTAEDVSFLAKAILVTRNYTHWQVINDNFTVPFEKGSVVTSYRSSEQNWSLAPERERKKYIKSELIKPRSSLTIRGALTKGLSESTSDIPKTASKRGGMLTEIYFEKDLVPRFAFDIGIRIEKELLGYSEGSVETTRSMLLLNSYYYFDQLRQYLNESLIYAGLGVGHGISTTTVDSFKQSGSVTMIPSAKLGLEIPLDLDWAFLGDFALESLQTKEKMTNGDIQTTDQTNLKFGIGLRKILNP